MLGVRQIGCCVWRCLCYFASLNVWFISFLKCVSCLLRFEVTAGCFRCGFVGIRLVNNLYVKFLLKGVVLWNWLVEPFAEFHAICIGRWLVSVLPCGKCRRRKYFGDNCARTMRGRRKPA